MICTLKWAQDLYPEARDLIFTTPSGQSISADYLAKHFRSIIDLAGVVPAVFLSPAKNGTTAIGASG